MRPKDVASTSFRRHAHTTFIINQCQIITFLILKSDSIKNSRTELKEIVLQVSSNQIKVTFIIILPFNLVHLWFFLFHIEIEGKCGWLIGGPKGLLAPLSNYWGARPPCPHPLFLRLCPSRKRTMSHQMSQERKKIVWSERDSNLGPFLSIWVFPAVIMISCLSNVCLNTIQGWQFSPWKSFLMTCKHSIGF